jgi:hypothetical protein
VEAEVLTATGTNRTVAGEMVVEEDVEIVTVEELEIGLLSEEVA